MGFDVKALIPQGLTWRPNYAGLLNNLMTLIICQSLREIGEMTCVTSAWSSRGQTLKSDHINPARRTPKCWRIWRRRRIWQKWRFCQNFAKVVHEMIRANKCNPTRRATKCWRIWRKRRIWRKWRCWWNFARVVDKMLGANKLTQVEGPRNVGEFGKSGDFGEISPRLSTKWSERID